MSQENTNSKKNYPNIGLGVGFGAMYGLIFGMIFLDNLSLGLSIGAAVGLVLSLSLGSLGRRPVYTLFGVCLGAALGVLLGLVLGILHGWYAAANNLGGITSLLGLLPYKEGYPAITALLLAALGLVLGANRDARRSSS